MFVPFEGLFIRFFHTNYNYAFSFKNIFSMEVLIVIISKDKWTSRNRTTTDRDQISFFLLLLLYMK